MWVIALWVTEVPFSAIIRATPVVSPFKFAKASSRKGWTIVLNRAMAWIVMYNALIITYALS